MQQGLATLPELTDRTNWAVSMGVFVAHLVLLWGLTYWGTQMQKQVVVKKLMVRTVSLQPAGGPVEAIVSHTPPPPPPPAPTPVEEAYEEPVVEPAPIPIEVPEEIPVPTPTPAPKPKAAAKPQPKPKPKPVVKAKPKPKPAPKPVVKPKPKPASKPAPKKETKKAPAPSVDQAAVARQKELENRQKALVNSALTSLDKAGKIDAKKGQIQADSGKVATQAPSKIAALASDSLVSIEGGQESDFTPQERTYYDELVSRLKLSLKLPEFGQVKLSLTINRQGKVVSVTGIKGKSKKNSDYIQKTVPKINFPSFGQNFSGEKEHTFRLTLSNELSY